jgi:hypothetical protein
MSLRNCGTFSPDILHLKLSQWKAEEVWATNYVVTHKSTDTSISVAYAAFVLRIYLKMVASGSYELLMRIYHTRWRNFLDGSRPFRLWVI